MIISININLSLIYNSDCQFIHTLRNIVQTNGNFLLIGAQQKTYLALSGNGTCCIISARNLKSSILHIKYNESSTVDNEIKIS